MPFISHFHVKTFLLICLFSDTDSGHTNDKPVIGILAEQSSSHKHGDEFVEAMYVRFLEMAGARVVPVLAKKPIDYYTQLFKNLNGVLFPGGGVNITGGPYYTAGKIFFDSAKRANDEGDYFPIWGTCLGFELLTVLVADFDLLSHVDAENLTLPLNFTKDFHQSRIFKDAPSDVLKYLSMEPVTENNHQYGLTTQTFNKTKRLVDFFHLLSTNVDRKGMQFVSTVEAFKYPFYATQWHPEKNVFLWDPNSDINHSAHAIRVTQYMADFFVNEARKSSHHFPSEDDVAQAVIENNIDVYLPNVRSRETYYFNYTKNGKN